RRLPTVARSHHEPHSAGDRARKESPRPLNGLRAASPTGDVRCRYDDAAGDRSLHERKRARVWFPEQAATPPRWKFFRAAECAPRFPYGWTRSKPGRAGKSGRLKFCPRASAPAADAPARLPAHQTAKPRNERRKLPDALFRCSVQTLLFIAKPAFMITLPGQQDARPALRRIITYE